MQASTIGMSTDSMVSKKPSNKSRLITDLSKRIAQAMNKAKKDEDSDESWDSD